MTTLILAVSVSVVVSALCSLLEAVLYSTRMVTLEAAAIHGNRVALIMRALKLKVDRPLAAILILNTAANTAGAALSGWAAAEVWGAGSLWVFSACFTLAILIFSEIIPKTVGAVYWRSLWGPSVYPLRVMVAGLRPIIWLTRMVTGLVTRGREMSVKISEEEILAAARLGAKGGQISSLEADLINNIIGLEELSAADIMTPRTVMLSVDGSRRIGQVQPEARAWDHTRVPVYSGRPDEVVGYVLKDDIGLVEGPALERPVASLAKPVRFLPPSTNALLLLSGFLRRREHLALVVDEYGGIMGLVTLEDVIESLVGSEIVDETDQDEDLQEVARRRGRAMLAQGEEDTP